MNMSKREQVLALIIAVSVGGWGLWSWVVTPAFAALGTIDEQTQQAQADLDLAELLIEKEREILTTWAGYRRAGLTRSRGEADAQTSGALYTWAEEAGLTKVTLSNEQSKDDPDQAFNELSYTLKGAGQLDAVFELLCRIDESPFPLRLEKCVVDQQNDESLQLSLTLSTLYKKEAGQ